MPNDKKCSRSSQSGLKSSIDPAFPAKNTSFILAAAGLLAGIGIGAAGFAFALTHCQSGPANVGSDLSMTSSNAPTTQATKAQTTAPAAVAQAQPVAALATPMSAAPQQLADQPAVGGDVDAGGPTGMAYAVTTSGSGGVYTQITPIYSGNPNWTQGNNGLIQNPCVDPPSSHGRAYRTNY